MTATDARIRIGCFAGGDPHDVSLWSGTPHYALKALERHFDVVFVERNPFPSLWHPLARAALKLSGGRLDPRMLPWLVRVATRASRRRLESCGADYLVSFAASNLSSMIDPDQRQILVSDATSIAISRYYPALSAHWPLVRRGYAGMERAAMDQAMLLAYPSHWAADSAVTDFGMDPAKVMVLPWGPNLDKTLLAPRPRTLRDEALRLLFVGIDWQRKGGDVVLEAVRVLHERGLTCTLDVIGVTSSAARVPIPPGVTFHGRLNKAVPVEAALFNDLFDRAHLFVLPTRAEALGMVFAEAAAIGLPSISYATGGVETVVRDGATGILMPLEAGGQEFADAIARLAADTDRYEALSREALRDSQVRLDWDVWAASLKQAILSRAGAESR